MLHSRIASLPHGVQLEQRVKVHKLDARDVVDFLSLNDVTQIVVHRLEGMRVSIGHRIAQNSTVIANKHEVDAPRVDANRGNGQSPAGNLLQTANHLEIQGIDVPIKVSARFYQIVWETGNLFLFQPSVGHAANNGSSTGSPQVDGKEIRFVFHLSYCSLFCIQATKVRINEHTTK